MNQVELSKNALAKLAELREQISVLEECCKSINNIIIADKFLDKKLVLKTQSALINFVSIDGDLRDIYEKLPLGTLPDEVSKAYGVVRDYHEEVSVKEKYRKAISFLNSLHCGDAAIESIINTELDKVSSLNISVASENELQKYNKYVDLHCFYNGEESLLANVAMEFPYELIIKIIRDKSDFCVYKVPIDEADKMQLPKITEETSNMQDSEDKTEEASNMQESGNKTEEASEVKELEAVAEASEIKESEVVVESSEIKESKTTEATANKDLEGSSNSIVENSNSYAVEIPTSAFWSITVPGKTIRYESKEKKNNTASAVRREMISLTSRDCNSKTVLEFSDNLAFNGQIFSDKYWRLINNNSLPLSNNDTLLDNEMYSLNEFNKYGYLVQYEFEKYDNLYGITDKGLRLLNNQKNTEIRNSRKEYLKKIYKYAIEKNDFSGPILYGSIPRILYNLRARNVRFKCTYTSKECLKYYIGVLNCKSISGNKGSVTLTGIVSNDAQDFSEFLNKLDEDNLFMSQDAFVVVGFTKEHAKSVLEWITASRTEALHSKDKYYFVVDDMKLYSYRDDTSIDDIERVFNIYTEENKAIDAKSRSIEDDSNLESNVEKIFLEANGDTSNQREVCVVKEDDIKKPEEEVAISEKELVNEKDLGKVGVKEVVVEEKKSTEIGLEDGIDVFAVRTSDLENKTDIKCESISDDNGYENTLKQNFSKDIRQEYLQTYRNILATGKMYCASAYMRKLYEMDSKFENEYMCLAYAINDPLASCDYNSDKIINVYFSSDETSGYLLASAMLRNFYSNQYGYDYKMEALMDSVREMEPFALDKDLRQLLEVLKNFKDKNHFGMAKLSDYSIRNIDILKQKLNSLSKQAENQMILSMEVSRKTGISNRRLYETRKFLFDQGSDLCEYLNLAIKRDINDTSISLLRDYLVNTYIKDGTEISDENIDANKINAVVDDAWEKAGHSINNKKNVQLVSGARSTVIHKIYDIVKVLCQFLNVASAIVEDSLKDYLPAYQRSQKNALEKIDKLILNYTSQDKNQENICYEKNVLLYTLNELKASLNGNERGFTGKYLYLPFLEVDDVILDNNCLPSLRDIRELPSMDVLKRIEKHAKSCHTPLVERLNGILHNDKEVWIDLSNGDNYGSIELMLEYLEENNPGFADKCRSENRIGEAISFGKEEIRRRLNEFKNDLELRQIYGQLDDAEENKKECILETVDRLYEKAYESHNFGFFKKVLKSFTEQIEADAKSQGKRINENLKAFLDSYTAEDDLYSEIIEKMVKRVREYIKLQKYASAEDLINRLENKDYDLENEPKERDYLREFLSQYDSIQRRISDNSKSLVVQVPINRKVSKEQRSAQKLINAWPKSDSGKEVNETKLRELLSHLGFSVGEIERDKIIAGKFTNFNVTLEKAQVGRRNNYRHPIAALGSIAENFSFKVVYIFGKYDADQLSAVCSDIGDARHNIVLLDYALKENERRKLARLIKNKASNKIFAVIDRVVLTHIADNYSEQTVLARLMQIIMPYSYYQPYVADPKQTMPPEIFIGRKDELDDIKSADGANIVYGGRQLGKSALLKKAYKDIDKNESGDRAIYIDIKGMGYQKAASKVCQELIMAKILDKSCKCDDWNELAMHIKERLLVEGSNKISYFLLLLDEADAFLESCKSIGYRPFDALKDIQSVGYGRFKFVIAGLRNVIRFSKAALENNSVLPQLKSTTVKPFKAVEARRLIEYPLSYLGFRFEDNMETDALVSTILSQTNCFPGLLQLYCSKLIEAMGQGYAGYNESGTPPYIVSENHIKKVLGEQNLQDEIKEKFFITLYVGDDNYYYLIALIVAFLRDDESVDGITPGRVLKFAEEYGIGVLKDLKEENIEALMEEMRELNVLQHEGNHGYRFTRLNFPRMMGDKAKIEECLLEFMEEA